MSEWMQTYGGSRFFFDATAGESTVSIIDIARALSRIPRFGGHAPISVCEHSCIVMEIVQTEGGTEKQQLYALLHDAHEAYTGDLISPLKAYLKDRYHVDLGGLQREVQSRIYQGLGVAQPEPAEMALVDRADLFALAAERRLYMPSNHHWVVDGVTIPDYIEGSYGAWHEDEAMRIFEKNYDRLKSVIDFEQREPL